MTRQSRDLRARRRSGLGCDGDVERIAGWFPWSTGRRRIGGVITDRDMCIAAATRHRRPGRDPRAREAMTRSALHGGKPDDGVKVALDAMGSHQIRRVPVVRREQQAAGRGVDQRARDPARPDLKGGSDAGITAERHYAHTLQAICAHPASGGQIEARCAHVSAAGRRDSWRTARPTPRPGGGHAREEDSGARASRARVSAGARRSALADQPPEPRLVEQRDAGGPSRAGA